MENIKYTTDGRKVLVMGSLNAKEMIIQEIFVQKDGTEIPSGENSIIAKVFLLDEPTISWKEKAIRDLDERYKKDSVEYPKMIEKLKKEYEDSTRVMREKLKFVGKALEKVNPEVFNTLIDYITGEISWVILYNYNTTSLIHIDELSQLYEGKLRLISLFGETNGDLNYHIGSYSDYSGGSKRISVYRDYESGVLELTKIFEEMESYNESTITEAIKHKIKLDYSKFHAFKDKKIESLDRDIKYRQEELKKKTEEKESFLKFVLDIRENIF